MKISAVFSDYDGTLAPIDAPLGSSRVPEEVEQALLRVGSSVPVAIVTSKDYDFVRPRTRFAAAWACVSGLEIVLADGTKLETERTSGRLLEGLQHAKSRAGAGLAFELKRSSTGELLGFSAHWRGASPPRRFVEEVSVGLREMGLEVVRDPGWPFLDVFGARPDKGRAVRRLRRLLNVKGNLMFLGDSKTDRSAFEEAEVAICVEHGQGVEELGCRFAVGYPELGRFLGSLADHDLSLSTGSLRRKRAEPDDPQLRRVSHYTT